MFYSKNSYCSISFFLMVLVIWFVTIFTLHYYTFLHFISDQLQFRNVDILYI